MIQELPKQPLEDPELGPKGLRTPYSVDEPIDPKGRGSEPGSEPDYFPGKPGNEQPRFRIAQRRPRLIVGRLQAN